MSHEIRTPINGIIGVLELLNHTGLNRQQTEYIGMLETSADILLQLINDILDFSKIEAGYLELEKIDFDLRTTLNKISDMLALKAHKKGLEFGLCLEPNVPSLLNGDPARLSQIIINLAGNAVKFTQTGKVSIACKLESQDKGSVRLHFTVSDTGIGIPKDKLDIIFESFRQVDGSTTRRFGGTGLGLPICRQLLEMMGGRTWVESELGKGSVFYFTIGFGLQDEKKQKMYDFTSKGLESAGGEEQRRGLKILLAEDDLINRRVGVGILEKMGHSVKVAEDGERAVEFFGKHAFDLALMDVQMPGIDGLEATARIRRC